MPKVTGLPPDTVLDLADLFPMVSNGATKKVTLQTVLDTLSPLVLANYDGWIEDVHPAPTTTTYNGNRSFTNVYPSSVAAYGGVGTRKRFTRTVAGQTQCANLESSSSQYFNKTSPAGMTWTDDFAGGGWVKLESYTGATQCIESRFNGTSGWALYVLASGIVALYGYNAGAGNASLVQSTQALTLNKWIYVTAQLDMSAFTATTTTSYVMIDGVDVPASVTRTGTNPTALVQAGNLEVGGNNGGLLPFDGKVAQVWVSSAKVTQANAKLLYGQGITSALITTCSIASAYSFANSINDLNTTNANNLTAQNSAAATDVDSMFGNYLGGTEEYAIQTSLSSDGLTETVQLPEGCALPTSGGITAVAFSRVDVPHGFPAAHGRWGLISQYPSTLITPVFSTYYNLASSKLSIPVGAWRTGYEMTALRGATTLTTSGFVNAISVLSVTAANAGTTEEGQYWRGNAGTDGYATGSIALTANNPVHREKLLIFNSITDHYLNFQLTGSGTPISSSSGCNGPFHIFAEFAYL